MGSSKKKKYPPGMLPPSPDLLGLMFDAVDFSKVETFSTSEVARFFFFRSAAWMRWKHGEGAFKNPTTGDVVEPSRDRRNARRYTVLDIERLAHAMYANGSISEAQLLAIKGLLWWTGVGAGIPFYEPESDDV